MARIELPPNLPMPNGSVGLRAEQPADAAFLRRLFDMSRPLAAQLAHLPVDLRDAIMQGQFHAQCQGYRAQFPQAQGFVMTVEGAPVGRLLVDDSGTTLHIADLALLPGWRGQGIGTMLLLHLAGTAAPRGLSLSVAEENTAAQRLYARLGFAVTARVPGYFQLARPAA